ncbi:phosphotransferase family protein [Isoptericola sp. NPDC019693]|uniref:phosphotransferase family protein n=1 Tax=Isoptericola sp. NPDC019693 TaxID=3364009 RepID=UPI0037931EC2
MIPDCIELGALSDRQRGLLGTWLPDLEVEADMSWGLVATTVLRVAADGRTLVVKAGGERDHHIAREVRAHREWTGPWLAGCRGASPDDDRIGRLVHADVDAKLLVTTFQPGRLVQDDPGAAADPGTYEQAGRLLAAFHGQLSVEDAGYEARANHRSEEWLAGPHRIAAADVARLRALIRSWPTSPAVLVPTHGDWQGRNWLVDDGVVRVIDLGRADLRPAASDLGRLATREFRRFSGAEEAFLSGYGHDPREPDAWFRSQVREAIGTACWAHQVGDEAFEAEGHRQVAQVLGDADGARPACP